ncbi:hypothetical protein TNCV_5032981 [Trichonephila clavipes]|nr:hypothetical protein TNCV_5032981 [Trichonephila clavipes]
MERGSPIAWPPRSPDITPLDFCGSINESQARLGTKHWEIRFKLTTLSDIFSCISELNGHVYCDGHSRPWPSWAVTPLSLVLRISPGRKRSTGTLGIGGSKSLTRKSGYVQLIRAPGLMPQAPNG